MQCLLHGLPGIVPYFVDVLISASCWSKLIKRVRAVLLRFRKSSLKLKKHKSEIPKIDFFSYLIDKKGIYPTPSKTTAIKQATVPMCRAELQSFLGLLNFYNVFLPHKASVAEPLHCLLSKDTPWSWMKVPPPVLFKGSRICSPHLLYWFIQFSPASCSDSRRLPIRDRCHIKPQIS